MNTETIFVYGTLREGGSNHFRLAGSTPLGRGAVSGKLYRIDWYPAVFLDPDADRVHGELHQVSPETLASLDDFEGDEYRRVRVAVTLENGDKSIDAWIWEYLEPVDESQRIPNGDWLSVALTD